MATRDETVKSKEETRAYLGNTQNNALSNPCMKEQHLSMDCLERHNDDKDACEIFFANYKACRAFWNSVIRERRSAGIKPYLPLPEDRAEIKARKLGSMG